MSDNNITVVGTATRDPELRYTQGGQGIANLSVAVNRRWQQAGEWKEEVSFFNVTAWGALGENVVQSVVKGTRIIVSGRMSQRSYEKDGEKKQAFEIVADDIGPSLKWATAAVTRTERSENTTGGSRQSKPQEQSDPFPNEESF